MAETKCVLLDSSVIIAALLSSTGGSFFIITQLAHRFKLQTTEYVLSEIRDVLKRKFLDQADLPTELLALLTIGRVTILPIESVAATKKLLKIINRDDASILASALAHSRFLLSLDKHFIASAVVAFAAARNLNICTPAFFIQKYVKS